MGNPFANSMIVGQLGEASFPKIWQLCQNLYMSAWDYQNSGFSHEEISMQQRKEKPEGSSKIKTYITVEVSFYIIWLTDVFYTLLERMWIWNL